MNLELFLLNDKMATSKSSRAWSLDPLDILDFFAHSFKLYLMKPFDRTPGLVKILLNIK